MGYKMDDLLTSYLQMFIAARSAQARKTATTEKKAQQGGGGGGGGVRREAVAAHQRECA
jgi:hypothetical protein